MAKILFKDKVFGNSNKKANDVLVDKIEGTDADNVQTAVAELYGKISESVNTINEYKSQLDFLHHRMLTDPFY